MLSVSKRVFLSLKVPSESDDVAVWCGVFFRGGRGGGRHECFVFTIVLVWFSRQFRNERSRRPGETLSAVCVCLHFFIVACFWLKNVLSACLFRADIMFAYSRTGRRTPVRRLPWRDLTPIPAWTSGRWRTCSGSAGIAPMTSPTREKFCSVDTPSPETLREGLRVSEKMM